MQLLCRAASNAGIADMIAGIHMLGAAGHVVICARAAQALCGEIRAGRLLAGTSLPTCGSVVARNTSLFCVVSQAILLLSHPLWMPGQWLC